MPLLGDLGLDVKDAVKSLHEIDERFEKTVGNLAKFGGLAGGSLAAFEGLNRIMEGFEGVLRLSENLNSLHFATGQSVHDLEIFNQALEVAGVGSSNAQGLIFKLQQAISGVNEEGKSTAEAFGALHLVPEDLKSKGVLEQVELLSKAFGNLKTQEDKAAAAGDLFGKRQGAEALRIFANPEALETARRQAEPLAAIMDANAQKFEELAHAIDGVKLNMQEFFAGALESVAGDATGVANALHSIDFVAIGRDAGMMLDTFVKLAKVFLDLAPAINKAADALHHMPHRTDALVSAGVGATIGAFGGPLGAIAGGGLGFGLGLLFGHDRPEAARSSWADAYKGLGDLGTPHADNSPVGQLQRIGLGGGFSLAGKDAILTENQRQTAELTQIRTILATHYGAGTTPHVDVPHV